jgi:hypothetical protein
MRNRVLATLPVVAAVVIVGGLALAQDIGGNGGGSGGTTAADAAVAAHVAASDPHTQYALESTIGAANGIASLDSGGKVPSAQLPTSSVTYTGQIVRVTRTTTQSIGNGADPVYAQFDTELYDPAGAHDNVTNNTRITSQEKGLYLVYADIYFAAGSGSGIRQVSLRKNGTGVASNISAGTASGNDLPVVTIINLDVGDYIEAYVYQNSGGNLNISPSGTPSQMGFAKLSAFP